MAKQFKDASGKTWDVPVNVSTIRRTKDSIEINLLDVVAGDGALMKTLATDPITLCNVLYCICKDQADKAGIDDWKFGELLLGDVLEDAALALLEGLTDFFPKGKRQLLQTALAKLNAYESQIVERLQKRLDSPEMDQACQAMVEREFVALNKSLTSLRESVA